MARDQALQIPSRRGRSIGSVLQAAERADRLGTADVPLAQALRRRRAGKLLPSLKRLRSLMRQNPVPMTTGRCTAPSAGWVREEVMR
jgi:hypothetical protein